MDSETFNEEQINSTENGSTNVKQRVKERNRSQSSLNSNTDINDPENLDYEEEDGPKTFNKNNSSAEENNRQEKLTAGSDEEGELDEADLEDGEIHDTNPNKSKSNELEQENVESVEISKIRASPPPTSKGPCRFFLQGRCHWGSNCKYGHSNGEQMKSLSNEVSPTKANLSPTGPQKIVGGKTNWISPSIPTTPQTHFFPNVHVLGATNVSTGPSAGTESAWERGLRSAKTLREQSMRRKQEDKDFNEKKYNLSVRHATDEKPIDEHCHEVESQRNDSNVIEDRNYPDRFHSSSFTNFPNNHRANRSNNFNHDRRRNDKFPMKNRTIESTQLIHSRQANTSPGSISLIETTVRNEEFLTSQKRRPSQKQYSTGALNGDENSSHFHGSNRRADDWQDPWDRSRNHRNPTYRRRASSPRKPSYSSSSRSSSSSSRSRSSSSSSSSRSRSRSRRRSSPGNRPRRLSETMKNGTEKKSVPNSPPSTNKFLPGRQISSHTLKKAEKSSNQSHSSSNHHRKNSSKRRSRKSRAESESSSSSSSSSDTDHRRASTSSSSSSTSENETPASTVPKSKSASKPTSKNATEKSVNKQEISSTGGNAAATRNSKTDSSKKRRDTSSSTGSASTSNHKKAKLISDSQKSSGDSPNDSESKLKKQKLLREIHEAENLISQRSTKTSS